MSDYSDLIHRTYGPGGQVPQIAGAQVTSTIQDNPDDAARSLELSQATGTPAAVIHGDLDEFERQHKMALASSIVAGNRALSNYVTSNQMASRVSNDDYGQLDKVSQTITKLGDKSFIQQLAGQYYPPPPSTGGQLPEVDLDQMSKDTRDIATDAYHGMISAPGQLIGVTRSPTWEAFGEQLDKWAQSLGVSSTVSKPVIGAALKPGEMSEAFGSAAFAPAMMALAPVFGAFRTYVSRPIEQASGVPKEVTEGLTQLALLGLGAAKGGKTAGKVVDQFQNEAKMYVDAGKEPPVGMSLVTDLLKAEQADLDLGNLQEALKESVASRTRDRSPEMYLEFLRQHPEIEGKKIGIAPEAIEKLYGDKIPDANDNMFGWVPEIGKQVRQAMEAGTDVEVLLADFLARVDPKVVKEIEGDLRLREQGLTVEEAKAADEEVKGGVETGVDVDKPVGPIDTVRGNAGLRPIIDVFHGSPHEFSAFDMGKVGTGEGAQSYGHGLYFAESRGVAGDYQKRLSGGTFSKEARADPELGPRIAEAEKQYAQAEEEFTKQAQPAEAGEGNREAEYLARQNLRMASHYLEGVQRDAEERFPSGKLYRVRINADKEHFLDFDKPLKEQTPEIKAKLIALVEKHIPEETRVRDTINTTDMTTGEWLDAMGGGQHGLMFNNPAELSAALKEAGIPGIKYLDQGSRGAIDPVKTQQEIDQLKSEIARLSPKERAAEADMIQAYEKEIAELEAGLAKQTHNFVLFDDSLAQITHVNDIPTEAFKAQEAEATKPKGRYRKPKQLEFDLSSLDEREAFEKANAIGMTVDQYGRYLRLIEKQRAEDLDWATRRALRDERKRQTDEWRANSAAIRKDVVEEFNQRPDIAADRFFRDSKLYGEELQEQPRLGVEFLTDEEKQALPKSYVRAKGMNPDDAARLLGYDTGAEMIYDLAKLHTDRLSMGGRPDEFFRKMVDAETARRMEEKYGDLGQNILREAQERALSATQIDMLHEETLALGIKAGAQFSITKEQLAKWTADRFAEQSVDSVSSDKFLAAAGKAGRGAETALLKGDFADAFRFKQQQYLAVRYAKLAQELEKEQGKFDKFAKRFSKSEVNGVLPQFTDAIQWLLAQTGHAVGRLPNEITENMQRHGYDSFGDFVRWEYNNTYGSVDLPIPDYMMDPGWKKPVNQMSVGEWREFNDATQALLERGREEFQADTRSKKMQFDAIRDELVANLEKYPIRKADDQAGVGRSITALPRWAYRAMVSPETLFDEFGHLNRDSMWHKFALYRAARAANLEADLVRDFSRAYGKLGEVTNKDRLMESPFIDPKTIDAKTNPDGSPLRFTRGNLQTLVHHMGNESNFTKLARGWGWDDPSALRSWIMARAPKEMFDRAQALGDLFKDLYTKAEDVYTRMYGKPPERVPLEPFEVTHGNGTTSQYKGWYHPIIKDPEREFYYNADGERMAGITKDQMGPAPFDDPNTFHARTANGFTKSRTDVVYPVDLALESIEARMRQMAHDIAFREVVTDFDKMFKDGHLRDQLGKRWGQDYVKMLDAYVERLAGNANYDAASIAQAKAVSEYFRQNTIATYIGFNPKTIEKHGLTAWAYSVKQVGARPFVSAMVDTWGVDGAKIRDFITESSGEIRRRERNWKDTFAGEQAEMFGDMTARERIIDWGSKGVALSDKFSAMPTWLASYREAMKEGMSHAEAVDRADLDVRQAHGSTAISNQPELVAEKGLGHNWMTSVYGFWGATMQRRFQMNMELNRAWNLGREGEIKAAAGKYLDVMKSAAVYYGITLAVEEFVTSQFTEDKHGLGAKTLIALGGSAASSLIYLRDIAYSLQSGRESVGLVSSPLHDLMNVIRDIKDPKKAFTKEHAGRTIQDFINVVGITTGMAPAQVGKVLRFGADVFNRQQRPQGPGQVVRGLVSGHAERFKVK